MAALRYRFARGTHRILHLCGVGRGQEGSAAEPSFAEGESPAPQARGVGRSPTAAPPRLCCAAVGGGAAAQKRGLRHRRSPDGGNGEHVEIISNAHPRFDFKPVDSVVLKASMKTPHKNAVRMLLKMLAYKERDTLLPEKWEIEHILPQKWQSAYFISESDEVILEKIEHLGNKLLFEKKLNIIAGNGYFDKKKKEYASSAVAITKAMSGDPSHDWKLDDITERDVHTVEAILDMIEGWNKAYDSVGFADNSRERPSAEELALIEKFKSKGWVNSYKPSAAQS